MHLLRNKKANSHDVNKPLQIYQNYKNIKNVRQQPFHNIRAIYAVKPLLFV